MGKWELNGGEGTKKAVRKMAELRLGGNKMTAGGGEADQSTLTVGSSKASLSHLSTCSEVSGKKLREKKR